MKQKIHSGFALLLVAILTASLLCGCQNKKENYSDKTSVIESVPTTESDGENTTAVKPNETTGGSGLTENDDSGAATEKSTAVFAQKGTPAPSSEATESITPPEAEKPTESSTPQSTASTVTEAPTKSNMPASFTACSINTSQLGTFRYWLYTPSDPTENMPLIVYLHGGSGKGDDLNLITAVDGFPQYLQSGQLGDVRAYVVIPQLPSTQKGWVNAAESISELIDHTVSTYKINKSNVSLTGHSMGGTGTWNLACTYPSLFARIAPLSGSIRNTPDIIGKLKNIPIRSFVGSADTIVPPDSSKEVIAALKAAGGSAEITVFDGADHFSVPSLTFLDTNIDLIGWLIGG